MTRDGESVGSWKRRTRFVGHDVVPATTYVYEVAALDEFGVATAPAGSACTPDQRHPRRPRSRRVFDVRLHVRSSYGINGVDGYTAAWRVTPSCDEAVPRSCPGAADRAGPVRDRVQAGSLRGGGI